MRFKIPLITANGDCGQGETEKKQKRGRTAHQVGLFLMATFNEYCLRLLIFVG